jgi:hypothetical protein
MKTKRASLLQYKQLAEPTRTAIIISIIDTDALNAA